MKPTLTLFLFVAGTVFLTAQSTQVPAEPTQTVVLSEEGDSPVILFDKQEITQGELAAMDQKNIGDIQILTGEEAKERYGKYGDFGAIVISSTPAPAVQSEKPMDLQPAAPAEQVIEASSEKVKMSLGSGLTTYVLIDGKPSTMESLQSLRSDQIKSMEVIKGADAFEKYGEVAKDGAIEVITKQ